MLTPQVLLSLMVLFFGALFLMWFAVEQFGTRARVLRRLDRAVRGRDEDMISERRLPIKDQIIRWMSALGRRAPIFNAAQRREMRSQLMAAGYRQAGALSVLMGSSAFCGLVLVLFFAAFLWPFMGSGQTVLKGLSVIVAMYVGSMLPRIVLDKLVKSRQLAIADSFPDALDLMVICANAGLGLNATILRVAQEIEFLAPELSDEFSLTAAQLQLSGDTTAVLSEMADRVGLDSMRSLVSTLSQSRQYGTPISEALRILAASERTARRMRTEEAAAKLSTKMTLPMMLFILPTVMLIVGGPAFISLMNSFKSMGN